MGIGRIGSRNGLLTDSEPPRLCPLLLGGPTWAAPEAVVVRVERWNRVSLFAALIGLAAFLGAVALLPTLAGRLTILEQPLMWVALWLLMFGGGIAVLLLALPLNVACSGSRAGRSGPAGRAGGRWRTSERGRSGCGVWWVSPW